MNEIHKSNWKILLKPFQITCCRHCAIMKNLFNIRLKLYDSCWIGFLLFLVAIRVEFFWGENLITWPFNLLSTRNPFSSYSLKSKLYFYGIQVVNDTLQFGRHHFFLVFLLCGCIKPCNYTIHSFSAACN